MAEIREVDLLRFEQGDAAARRAVVDGVRRSLATGFVYTSHDVPEEAIDEAYAMLAEFFSMDQATKSQFVAPGSHGQTGYTGLLVEAAASADVPDWKDMLHRAAAPPEGPPRRRKYPHPYQDRALPEGEVRGLHTTSMRCPQRGADLHRP